MTAKTARRFLARNQWKLTVCKQNGTGKAKLKRARIAQKVLNQPTKGGKSK